MSDVGTLTPLTPLCTDALTDVRGRIYLCAAAVGRAVKTAGNGGGGIRRDRCVPLPRDWGPPPRGRGAGPASVLQGWERLAPAETLRRAWGRGGSVQPGGRSGPYQSRGIGTSSRWILAVP